MRVALHPPPSAEKRILLFCLCYLASTRYVVSVNIAPLDSAGRVQYKTIQVDSPERYQRMKYSPKEVDEVIDRLRVTADSLRGCDGAPHSILPSTALTPH